MRIVTNRDKLQTETEKANLTCLFLSDLVIPFDLSRLRQIVINLVSRLPTEGFQISHTLVSSARLHAVGPTDRNRRAIDGLRCRLHNTSNKL
jgi:hypothetical protein